jgi:hypothetical protein
VTSVDASLINGSWKNLAESPKVLSKQRFFSFFSFLSFSFFSFSFFFLFLFYFILFFSLGAKEMFLKPSINR